MSVKKLLIFITLLVPLVLLAQRPLQGIGEWEYHTPYNKGIAVADAGSLIYLASQNGLFSYQKESGEITLYSKVNGLSDVQISDIDYYEPLDILMIGYKNGNIDVFQNNTFINFNDILRKQIVGEKSINDIYINDGLAFLSTTFGVVVFDLNKLEVKETYSSIGMGGEVIGVNQTLILGDSIYLASESGVFRALFSESVNLLDFNNWTNIYDLASFSIIVNQANDLWLLQKDTSLVHKRENGIWKSVDQFNGTRTISESSDQLYFINDSTVTLMDNTGQSTELVDLSPLPMQIIKDGEVLWISDLTKGLGKYSNGSIEYLTPIGPSNSAIFDVNYSNNVMYVTQGGYTTNSVKLYRSFAVDKLGFDGWSTTGYWQSENLINVTDVVTAISDGDSKTYYSTNSSGIIIQENNVFTIYDDSNSPLKASSGDVRAPGIAMDSENNLWIGNHFLNIGDTSIYKLDSEGNWTPYVFPGISDSRFALKLYIDNNDVKWVILSSTGTGNGVLVFDEKNDLSRQLTMGFEKGDLQDNRINDIAFDEDGAVWMVGRAGVSVFQNPETIFDGGQNNDASKPIFDGRPLLENEYCTAIAVDGGNRKWIGTENGLFLIDPTGRELIESFNMDNSPLPTNKINDLELHPETGELFIATDLGLITYRTNSSEGKNACKGQIKVFPNPVTPDFNGEVGISVLTDDAEIKITDAWGNLVYETQANGGTGSWDLRDYTGTKAASGVYSILVSGQGRKKSCAENLAIIR